MNITISPVSVVIDVATGLIVFTLLLSGLAKMRTPDRTLTAMQGLGIPVLLQRRWVALLVPIFELVLGVILLTAPGPLRFLAAVATAALMTAFTFYVTRAVFRGVEVACECFGSASSAPVDRLTIARNALLLICALIATGVGLDGPSLVFSLDPVRLSVIALTLLAVGAAVLMARQHRHIDRLRAVINQTADRYRRASDEPLTGTPIPEAELVSASGVTKKLSGLGGGRAVLLIFTKAGCGDCANVARSLPEWTNQLRDVVRPVIATSSAPERLFAEYPEFVGHTFFGAHAAREALGIRSLPTAVLLAADGGSVATEVVEGSAAIAELVLALEEQVAHTPVGPAHPDSANRLHD